MRIRDLLANALGVLSIVILVLLVLSFPYLTGELTFYVPNLGGYHIQID